jgi:hypothetical protein
VIGKYIWRYGFGQTERLNFIKRVNQFSEAVHLHYAMFHLVICPACRFVGHHVEMAVNPVIVIYILDNNTASPRSHPALPLSLSQHWLFPLHA